MTPSDPLDAGSIRTGLASLGESFEVELRERCGSTNAELLARNAAGVQSRCAPPLLFAEEQTAGRGRRGRRWYASPGSALMFSLRWQFSGPVARLRGLSLAVGVSLARSLHAIGARRVALKWPNDLVAPVVSTGGTADGKLGGVLIETHASRGHVAAVIGVGLNCRRVSGLEARLKRRVAVLEDLVVPMPARNAIAARLAAGLAGTLRTFDAGGFAAFRGEWEALHAYCGKRLTVRTSDGRRIAGIAEGVAADGALLLRNRGGLRSVNSGTVMRGPVMPGAA